MTNKEIEFETWYDKLCEIANSINDGATDAGVRDRQAVLFNLFSAGAPEADHAVWREVYDAGKTPEQAWRDAWR